MSSTSTMRLPKSSGIRKPKKPNAVRQIMEREQRIRDRNFKEQAASAASGANSPGVVSANRQQCPNPSCPKPNVVDGTCRTCGRVADDSNIVAEVTFGENSSGAAVVQGSYLAADQGGVRGVSGREFRRVAGSGASEAREKSIREAKGLMNQIKHQLNISDSMVDSGIRMFRVASTMNFIQGRTHRDVAAVVLYVACRQEPTCKVMLIDLADIIKTDVFKLGRIYKDFLAALPNPPNVRHVVPEDLIWRFAAKLEFYRDTNKVAESAIRIVKRMRWDEMTHGRRPAGICGAALVMAARSHNYRRTIREVVYVAKVTMVTLQNRLDEFANVPSANMTIDEFNTQDFLQAHHDPPWWYKQSAEWREKHTRSRKRRLPELDATDQSASADDTQGAEKRQKTTTEGDMASSAEGGSLPGPSVVLAPESISPIPSPGPAGVLPPAPLASNTDKDGFVVPPLPERALVSNASTPDGALRSATVQDEEELADLAAEFGDVEDEEDGRENDDADAMSEVAMAAAQGINIAGRAPGNAKGQPDKGKRKQMQELPIDADWENDEAMLEAEMEQHLQDPEAIAEAEAVAEQLAKKSQDRASRAPTEQESGSPAPTTASDAPAPEELAMLDGPILPPGISISADGDVSMNPHVHEDEFKDDPEVAYCLLGEDEIKLKEQIWSNQNKDYMRQKQQKYFNDKLNAKNPTKPRRPRGRKPRAGLDVGSPASSAAEAAENVLKTRAVSSRLNYKAMMEGIFQNTGRNGGPGSMYGGASSVGSRSAVTSRAGSVAGSDEDGALRSPSPPPRPTSAPTKASQAHKSLGTVQEEPGDEDDYANYDEPDYEDADGYQDGELDPFADDEPYGDDDY